MYGTHGELRRKFLVCGGVRGASLTAEISWTVEITNTEAILSVPTTSKKNFKCSFNKTKFHN